MSRQVVLDDVRLHETITSDRVCEACERQLTSLDNPGFCISCGEEQEGCEPDAERYTCECCEMPTVYGAMTLVLLMV